MKRFLFVIGLGLAVSSFAQSARQKHTIKDGESLSIIAKKYKTTVGDIMRLNGMNTNSKIAVGQVINIPEEGEHVVAGGTVSSSVETTKTQSSDENTGKTHTVATGESLYKISRQYGVSVDALKKYNNLADNNIKVGQVLQLSSTSAAANADASESQSVPEAKDPESVGNKNLNKVSAPAPIQKEELSSTSPVNAGVFSSDFEKDVDGRSLQTEQGNAGTFKTESGWSDKKYYIMMNNAPAGSIVKITYNNQSIFAKVLWNLNNVKDNKDLNYRISDAAASVLGINGNASIQVAYYQ